MSQKEKILEKLGKDHTDPIGFLGDIPYEKVYGLYTYENDVFCFREGSDIPFDELTQEEQTEVMVLFDSGKYEINEALQ